MQQFELRRLPDTMRRMRAKLERLVDHGAQRFPAYQLKCQPELQGIPAARGSERTIDEGGNPFGVVRLRVQIVGVHFEMAELARIAQCEGSAGNRLPKLLMEVDAD